jgi:hypothetical protein
MTDSMLPIIRQLHDADGDRARAKVLLAMPDTIILKQAGTVGTACLKAGFQAGAEYVLRRVALMRAVRGADGLLPPPLATDFDEFRGAFAAFANGRETE